MDTFSVLLYIVTMMAIGFSFLLLRLAIGRRLRRRGALELDDKAAEYKHLASLALYGVSLFLAFSHPNYALGIVALVMFIWIYPTAPTSLHPSKHRHLRPEH